MAHRKEIEDELLPLHLQRSVQNRTNALLVRMFTFLTGVAVGLLIMFAAIKQSINEGNVLSTCRYALGGGAVPPGGSFPQALIQAGRCTSEFQTYLEEQYDKDVETAIASAREYFDSYPFTPNASQIIVLDIDETALSNRAEWLTMLSVRKGGLISSSQGFAEAKAKKDDAPALQPMLDLYLDLYRRGFSMTFITGRTDSGNVRKNTARNLEAVGYGVPCSGAVAAAEEEACYVELGMREPEERDLLASVYKPKQRKKLQDKGYEVVASFGDQFSDLEGTSSAAASFKLPNPFYYIL